MGSFGWQRAKRRNVSPWKEIDANSGGRFLLAFRYGILRFQPFLDLCVFHEVIPEPASSDFVSERPNVIVGPTSAKALPAATGAGAFIGESLFHAEKLECGQDFMLRFKLEHGSVFIPLAVEIMGKFTERKLAMPEFVGDPVEIRNDAAFRETDKARSLLEPYRQCKG